MGAIPVKIEKKAEEPEKKRVKKKDPIALDLFSALQVKKQQPKKNAAVLAGKLEREEAEKRREDRIKAGISLKPLPRIDDDFDTVVDDKGKIKQKSDSEEFENNSDKNISMEVAQNVTPVDTTISKEKETKEDISSEKKTVEAVNLKTPLEMSVEEKALTALHSRKFRSYCSHILSAELDSSISLLMTDLVRFQDKQHAKDPVKAKARRRYVVGLREVAKFIKVKK